MCWIYRYWKAWNNSLDFYLICLHSYLLITLKLLFLSIGIWSPNYHSFWSNSSLWLHKYSIADEKVYLQRWMLNRSTIKIYYYFIPPHCWQNCAKKKLQIRDWMVTIQKWVNLDIFTSPNLVVLCRDPLVLLQCKTKSSWKYIVYASQSSTCVLGLFFIHAHWLTFHF